MLGPEPSQRVEGRQNPPISCREIEMGGQEANSVQDQEAKLV